MSLPTSTVRHTFRAELVTRLRAQTAIGGVQVESGWPGEAVEAESIWFGPSVGSREIPTMKAGRKQRQDTFTVPIEFEACEPGQTEAEAEARAAELFSALDDLLADDPTLGVDGVQKAVIREENGPNTVRTEAGAISAWHAEVEVEARYQ